MDLREFLEDNPGQRWHDHGGLCAPEFEFLPIFFSALAFFADEYSWRRSEEVKR